MEHVLQNVDEASRDEVWPVKEMMEHLYQILSVILSQNQMKQRDVIWLSVNKNSQVVILMIYNFQMGKYGQHVICDQQKHESEQILMDSIIKRSVEIMTVKVLGEVSRLLL